MPTTCFGPGRAFALALALLAIAGCGPTDTRPAVHPTTGRVRVDGQPAKDVYILFVPADAAAPRPTAVTDDQGNLVVTTYATGDGAPAGDYKLAVEWPAMVNQFGRVQRGKDQLNGRFKDPATSKWAVTIVPGPNTLPDIDVRTK